VLAEIRKPARNPALTGLRAVAALSVVGTHAAFATGTLTHGYLGAMSARMEIGVAIFFVLSGFLLFRPWVSAAAAGSTLPSVGRYARRRVRRILPGYLVAVLATFAVYTVFAPGPNPGQTLLGLLRYLTLTQIYTDNFLLTYLHPGLSQMWSLSVEVAFYAVLPALGYLLLTQLCRGRWRPELLLAGLLAIGAVSPLWLVVAHTTDWLPKAAGMWLPAHLSWFAGGMSLAVLKRIGVTFRAVVAIPLALALYLVVSTEVGGHILVPDTWWQPPAKSILYAAIATSIVAPVALGDRGRYSRLLSSRPMQRLGGISYEIFLLHVAVMALVMAVVLRWPLFTGSMTVLFSVTMAITIPLAMLLRGATRSWNTEPTPENTSRNSVAVYADQPERCARHSTTGTAAGRGRP
jgi:peptidoglycan/LPS O-acetylase OafA/YrhL